MIDRSAGVAALLERFPDFRPYWDAYQQDWANEPGDTSGACLDFATFSHYVADVIGGQAAGDLPAIFALVERLVAEGNEEVATAATTCLLENVLNRVPPLAPEQFVPLLGPRFRAYCRAWDEFCGTRTPGLW
jgi:hypothetical protein